MQPQRRAPGLGGRLNRPGAGMSLSQMGLPPPSALSSFSKYVGADGRLNFGNKASLNEKGIDFGNGTTYKINAQELQVLEELGRGQYGLVRKVMHLPTGVIMAMKEIRLELDQTKFDQIVMELQILHNANSPYIVEFYGAFYVETTVFICMEYMDCGSLDKLYQVGVQEPVLGKISLAIVKALKFLKDNLSVIHRDVKPTNVLINSNGLIKLCDFGVSGQLVASIAKTNIGCQSYMAPERISHMKPTAYTIHSDIWSLGLSLVETAVGRYPYPAEHYDSVFAQLSAIVEGEPPGPPEAFSPACKDFIKQCLNKEPTLRPNYDQLLHHPWLVTAEGQVVDLIAWAVSAKEYAAQHKK